MISSLFSTTKPISYAVLAVLLLLFYGVHLFTEAVWEMSFGHILLEVLTLIGLGLTLYVGNHIVQKAKIAASNTYTPLFFVLLLGLFPETFSDKDAIFANVLLLLTLWQVIAVKPTENLKHKIFNATIFLGIASLFYDWVFLFLGLIFCMIKIYDPKTVKNWLVPLVGLATVFVLVLTSLKLHGSLGFFREHYQFSTRFLTPDYTNSVSSQILTYVFLVFSIIAIVFVRVRSIGGGKLVVLRILLLTFVLGIAIVFITPTGTSPVVLTFFPTAVFIARALEALTKKKLREAALGLCILAPFLLFALRYLQ